MTGAWSGVPQLLMELLVVQWEKSQAGPYARSKQWERYRCWSQEQCLCQDESSSRIVAIRLQGGAPVHWNNQVIVLLARIPSEWSLLSEDLGANNACA